MPPTADEYAALRTRVDYLYRVVRAYRKLNRAFFAEGVVKGKLEIIQAQLDKLTISTEALRPHFVAKQVQWQAVETLVNVQSEKLKSFEHGKLDKQPPVEECFAHDWAGKNEKALLTRCRSYMQETLTMCSGIEAKAVEEAKKNIIIDVWLFGSWEQLEQVIEPLINESKKELIGQSD